MRKLFAIFCIFFLTLNYSFASTATLEIDKTEVSKNEILNLLITLDSNGEYKGLNGTENFNIISTSKSSSSSTQIQIINGEAQTQTKTQIKINVKISPISSGEFEIGPAIFLVDGNEIKSNNIVINVLNSVNSNTKNEENKGQIYMLIFILFFTVFWMIALYYYFKINKENINTEKLNNDEILNNEIIFPKPEEINFEQKLYKIFIGYLAKKFNIKNIETKTLSEIIENEEIKNNSDIKEISKLFNVLKYSNNKENKEEILKKIKNIIN